MSICEKCGQDHHAVFMCAGRTMGSRPKDPAKQRAAANKRWKDWRHARAIERRRKEAEIDW